MTIEDELGPPIPPHEDLPVHRWWACEHPERPAEANKVSFRRGCRRCLPGFLAMMWAGNGQAATPSGTPIAKGKATAMGDTPEEWRAWFMRDGSHAERG